MLPLAGESFPTTADELAAALQSGFETRGLVPHQITIEGKEYPELTQVSVDLTGGKITRENRPVDTAAKTGASSFLEIAQLELFGEPVYFEQTALEIRVEAEQVKMRVAGHPGNGSLMLESAAAGKISVKITHEALEDLLRSLVSGAAAKQGLEVKETKLDLEQDGARGVAFRAEVTAKVFIMNATLALTGRLDIDDAFNARLSALALDGDSMVVNLAGSFLRPRLQALEGRVFPLLAFSPGGLKLRDIELSVSPSLQVHARFGGPA